MNRGLRTQIVFTRGEIVLSLSDTGRQQANGASVCLLAFPLIGNMSPLRDS